MSTPPPLWPRDPRQPPQAHSQYSAAVWAWETAETNVQLKTLTFQGLKKVGVEQLPWNSFATLFLGMHQTVTGRQSSNDRAAPPSKFPINQLLSHSVPGKRGMGRLTHRFPQGPDCYLLLSRIAEIHFALHNISTNNSNYSSINITIYVWNIMARMSN